MDNKSKKRIYGVSAGILLVVVVLLGTLSQDKIKKIFQNSDSAENSLAAAVGADIPGNQVLVYDFNGAWTGTTTKIIEGSSQPWVNPIKANFDWTKPTNYAGGTLHFRINLKCMRSDDDFDLVWKFWQNLGPKPAEAYLLPAQVGGNLTFNYRSSPITKTFSFPVANLKNASANISQKIWQAFNWSKPRIDDGFYDPTDQGILKSIASSSKPLDIHATVVVVAKGKQFKGWDYWLPGANSEVGNCGDVPLSVQISANPSGPLYSPATTTLSWTTIGNPTSCEGVGDLYGANISNNQESSLQKGDLAPGSYNFGIVCHKEGQPDATSTISVVVNDGSILHTPKFEQHTIDETADLAYTEGTHPWSLTDLNHDGKLDWVGLFGINTQGVWPNKTTQQEFVWYKYVSPDVWEKNLVYTTPIRKLNVDSSVHTPLIRVQGTDAFLFDHKLFQSTNNGESWASTTLPLINRPGPSGHDVVVADIDEDGKDDIVLNNPKTVIEWRKQMDDISLWPAYTVDSEMAVKGVPKEIYSGLSTSGVCDIDGDGHLDITSPGRWYKNPYPNYSTSTPWETFWMTDTGTSMGNPLIGKKGTLKWQGYAVKSSCADMDLDGDMDIIQSENDATPASARVGWLENKGGGLFDTVHWIKTTSLPGEAPHDFHSLGVFDYDKDGDWDVVVADGNIPENQDAGKSIYIMENIRQQDGDKKPTSEFWIQHTIVPGDFDGDGNPDSTSAGRVCHELKLGDVDSDGKMDFVCMGHLYKELPGPDAPFIFYRNVTEI